MSQLPTIGRRVYFWPVGADRAGFNIIDSDFPFDAGVVFVHPQPPAPMPQLVNLTVTDHKGITQGVRNVPFVVQHDGVPPQGQSYAEWMPYQKGASHTAAPGA